VNKCCRDCQKLLPLSEFTRDSRNPDGLRNRCRSCQSDMDVGNYRRQKMREFNALISWAPPPNLQQGDY